LQSWPAVRSGGREMISGNVFLLLLQYMKTTFLFIAFLIFAKPLFAQSRKTLDSLPPSEIDIPIRINLRQFFAMADKTVDTLFTSPNYPTDWVQSDCATRYKYQFRRSPLRFSGNGTSMQIDFTGFYKIIGATRACVNGTAISPWTHDCSCGFKEGERKVNIGFTASFWLSPNYVLQTKIIRKEPQALDKCSVCFWGQDITATVMNSLKLELDASKKEMQNSLGLINLRSYMQQAWHSISQTYTIPNIGYFTLNPKKLRMDKLLTKKDLLNVNIGITATPVISFIKPDSFTAPLPNLSTVRTPEGFNIFLEAALQYDSLSRVLNGYLANKRFEISEGLIKQHVIIRSASLSGDASGRLNIKVDFTGSHTGTAYFTGKPVYNADKKTIEVENLEYDLQTNSFLLKTAKWLFSKKITSEVKKLTSFNLSTYYDAAAKTMNTWLNKEWTKGIRGAGGVTAIKLTDAFALPEHLLIRTNCVGKLAIEVRDLDLKL